MYLQGFMGTSITDGRMSFGLIDSDEWVDIPPSILRFLTVI